jgi:hypothetical protein
MSFAYLLESFPDPTKTFVFREVAEAVQEGLEPLIVSVREPSAEERSLQEGCDVPVVYLPPEAEFFVFLPAAAGIVALAERERGFQSRV